MTTLNLHKPTFWDTNIAKLDKEQDVVIFLNFCSFKKLTVYLCKIQKIKE